MSLFKSVLKLGLIRGGNAIRVEENTFEIPLGVIM